MGDPVVVTHDAFERIGFSPDDVLSEGFTLERFRFTLDVETRKFEFEVGLEGPDGTQTETVEHEMSKVVRGFERALQLHGILDERGLDPFLSGASQANLNGRKLDIPEDW